jgi:hypothetical protein
MLTALENPRSRTGEPGWFWEAKTKTGKVCSGWTRGASLKTKEQLIELLQTHFHNLVFDDFKAERRDNPPATTMLRPVPAAWFEFGTNRLVREILAGLRPDVPGMRIDGSYQCAAPPDRSQPTTPTPAIARGRIISVPTRKPLWRNREPRR